VKEIKVAELKFCPVRWEGAQKALILVICHLLCLVGIVTCLYTIFSKETNLYSLNLLWM